MISSVALVGLELAKILSICIKARLHEQVKQLMLTSHLLKESENIFSKAEVILDWMM